MREASEYMSPGRLDERPLFATRQLTLGSCLPL
jgi:hypothetical protein